MSVVNFSRSPRRVPVSGMSKFDPTFEQASTKRAEREGQCR